MKVLIITEGNQNIGFGHITRCLSLYQAFQGEKITPKLIINGDNSIDSLLESYQYEKINWLNLDDEYLFEFLISADICIIDSYLCKYDFYKKISELVNVPVYLDDNKRINYPKGIVVNGSGYSKDLDYPQVKGVEYLLGTQYIPLRKEFWDIPVKVINKKIKKIMVTFGGDDSKNMTPKILKILNKNYPFLNKYVIIGNGFNNVEKIEKIKCDRTELIYYPNAEIMKNIMLESDIAISAGGQTLNELARVGTPTIAISVADNQHNHVNYWKNKGFIESVGSADDKDLSDNLLQKLNILQNENIRLKKSKIGKKYVDGYGSIRIIEYCINKNKL